MFKIQKLFLAAAILIRIINSDRRLWLSVPVSPENHWRC